MRRLEVTSKFKKDARLAVRRGLDISKLNRIIDLLRDGIVLPDECRDHWLYGQYSDHRECHIEPDWLLIYRINDDGLVLTAVRTGSHSDLF